MARPLWTGTLGFGLVSIPIEIHSAVRDVGPHFHFLRKSDKSRIGYQKVAKDDGRPVTKDELVKGYEYQKGRYVLLTDKDFETAAVERNSRIDLLDFVAGSDVDDRYFDKPYYLLPGKGGEKAYGLLRETLRESGRLGIAKVVMRNAPHLAAVETISIAPGLHGLRVLFVNVFALEADAGWTLASRGWQSRSTTWDGRRRGATSIVRSEAEGGQPQRTAASQSVAAITPISLAACP